MLLLVLFLILLVDHLETRTGRNGEKISKNRKNRNQMIQRITSALLILLAIFDWHIIGKITVILAAFNFIFNSDPYGRLASIGVVVVLLLLTKIASKYDKERRS